MTRAEGDMASTDMTSLDFAWSVRALQPLAKRLGLKMPGYRSMKGEEFGVQMTSGGTWVVTVDHHQPGHRVLLDMIDGLILANERQAAQEACNAVCARCGHSIHASGDCATFFPPHPSPHVPSKCMCDRHNVARR